MDWLQSYDFLAPTNPYAALFFGVTFTIIIATVVWFETKEKKTVVVLLFIGCLLSLILVSVLNFIGFY
ncbi:hypothetical protein ACDX78_05850 [Virgibacillus oceani]